MRKNLLILVFVPFATLSFGQNFGHGGCIELGGSIGYSNQTEVFNGTTQPNSAHFFTFLPYIGYFIVDGLELGLNPLGYRYSSYENYSNHDITVMFAPSYNFDIKSNIYPFVEGRIGYTSHNFKDTNPPEVDETWSGISYGGAVGVKFILGESSLLKAGASYMLYTYKPEGADNRYGYNELMVELGFMIFFSKS